MNKNKLFLFVTELLNYAETNLREFPWRKEKDAFRVLIAELLLQRSRSSTVAKVYPDFIERWADAKGLSKAEIRDIEDVIRPLGLVNRAERLLLMAKKVVELGGIPKAVDEILTLPGVGQYAAITTAAISFGLHELAVDSVSRRVYLRYFHDDTEEQGTLTLQNIITRVTAIVPEGKIHMLKWAVLDVSGLVCLPKIPRCNICPCKAWCSSVEEV